MLLKLVKSLGVKKVIFLPDEFLAMNVAKETKKKSHQTEVKEVKMRYKIDKHDYDVRIGQAVSIF